MLCLGLLQFSERNLYLGLQGGTQRGRVRPFREASIWRLGGRCEPFLIVEGWHFTGQGQTLEFLDPGILST